MGLTEALAPACLDVAFSKVGLVTRLVRNLFYHEGRQGHEELNSILPEPRACRASHRRWVEKLLIISLGALCVLCGKTYFTKIEYHYFLENAFPENNSIHHPVFYFFILLRAYRPCESPMLSLPFLFLSNTKSR